MCHTFYSPASHRGPLGSISGQLTYDVWWPSGNRTGFSSSFSVYPVSIIPTSKPTFYSSTTDATCRSIQFMYIHPQACPYCLRRNNFSFFHSSSVTHFIHTGFSIHALVSTESAFQYHLYQMFLLPGETTSLF